MDALESQNAEKLLGVVHSLLDNGSDLRRFLLDLLDRIRDLMVINAVDSEKTQLLRKYSAEELQKLNGFATRTSIARLISLSEIVSEHLVRLRTAVSPQINIETMMFRLLRTTTTSDSTLPKMDESHPMSSEAPESGYKEVPHTAKTIKPTARPNSSASDKKIPLTDLRILENNWPRVLETIKHQRRLTWTLLSSQSQPTSFESGLVRISLPSSGALDSFERSNSSDVLKKAMEEIFERGFSIEMIIKGSQTMTSIRTTEVELSDSSDQVTGEELLIKELGAKVIYKEDE
jgi:DNA polymerase-3 subunit gamma/tau